MSDLISRKALIERLRELGRLEPDEIDTEIKLVAIINQLPTAYDVDKVMEQLEGEKGSVSDCNTAIGRALARHWNTAIDGCKQIVKGVAKDV